MTVYGTRPEAIKVAPVIKALDQDDRFESVPVSTGQHKEMLEQVNSMFEISSPFPEEANRRIIGQVAALHLAPTEGAMENLRKENFRSRDIVVTGNTVIDALLEAAGWDTEFADPVLQAAIANLFGLGERLPDFAPSAAD